MHFKDMPAMFTSEKPLPMAAYCLKNR